MGTRQPSANATTHTTPAPERRGMTVIHGLRATPQGDKPWVARLIHEPDFGFPLLIIAGAVLLEEAKQRGRDARLQFSGETPVDGVAAGLDAEALALRVIGDSRDKDGRALIRFDALSVGANPDVAPAVFGNELNLLQFGRPEDVGVSRVHVLDCRERSLRIYGHNITKLHDSPVEHLAFGAMPAMPAAWAEEVAELEARRALDKASLRPTPILTEREELLLDEARDIQLALSALRNNAGWSINGPSLLMQRIESAALGKAREVFDQEAAARLASNLRAGMRSAAAEPMGSAIEGVVALVDREHVYQHDPVREILWIHAVEDFHGNPPAEGQRVDVRYISPSHAEFSPIARPRETPRASTARLALVNRPPIFQHTGLER